MVFGQGSAHTCSSACTAVSEFHANVVPGIVPLTLARRRCGDGVGDASESAGVTFAASTAAAAAARSARTSREGVVNPGAPAVDPPATVAAATRPRLR